MSEGQQVCAFISLSSRTLCTRIFKSTRRGVSELCMATSMCQGWELAEKSISRKAGLARCEGP